jgi:hypothetical protein
MKSSAAPSTRTTGKSRWTHGANFVDLAGPSELPTPKEEKAAANWSFGPSSEDGNNLDFSAFNSRCR